MKTVIAKLISLSGLFCLFLLPTSSWGQINSGSPAVPFGSNKKYKYGIMPTNLPTSGTYGQAQDAADMYIAWKTKWIVNCSDGSQRVNWDDNSSTVSEGIGYGMLLAAYAGDKTLFDNLWKYFKTWSDTKGLMHWKITGCASVNGSGSASDADIDAAMALVVAAKQWPSATSPYKYSTEATNLITAIWNYDINSSSYQLINGDGWGASTCRNPSYQAPGYYKIYGQAVTSQATSWNNAITAANTMLNANVNSTTGLVSNWCDNTGAANGCNGNNEYGDDACRNPWRMCVDAVWNNGTTANNICTLLAKYIQGKGVTVIGGNVPQAGGNGNHTSMYVSTFATSVMGSSSTYQTTLNSMYTEAKVISTTGYFQDILKTLSFFVMSGNFWNPYDVANCKSPSVGGSKTLCGTSGSLTLSSGLTTATNRTFTWYKNGTAISSSPTYTVSLAGTYTVKVDSTNGCSSRDSAIVSSTLPTVSLGANQTLCSPAIATLDAGVSGTGITYLWKYSASTYANLSTISGQTAQTLTNVRSSGLYQAVVSASGCTSVSDTITVKSSNPTPVDGCNSATGTVKLSITNPGLNGTNYNWYSASTGGTALATASTSFTTPSISQTTTYYVQDMSAVSGTVGPTTMLGTTSSQQNWGCGQANVLNFTANSNFTLKAVTIPVNMYSVPSTGTVSIEIVDGSNTLKGSFTSDNVTISSVGGVQMVRFTFGSGSGVTIDKNTWGSTLKMRLAQSCMTLNGAPVWTQSVTPAFPYTSTGSIVSITGAELSSSATTTNYMYFYNWEISTGTTCDRLPVVASINSSCSTVVTGMDEMASETVSAIDVFPNPSSSTFSLTFSTAKQVNGSLQVFDQLGRVVYQKEVTSGEQFNFGEEFEQGIYHCRISYHGGVFTRSLIKR